MSSFGIKAYICSSIPSYYVGEDDVLWDWLMADNAAPSGLSSMLQVPAPAGYEFRQATSDVDIIDTPEGLYVGANSSRKDKACALILMLPHVEEADFESLGVNESRIVTISV